RVMLIHQLIKGFHQHQLVFLRYDATYIDKYFRMVIFSIFVYFIFNLDKTIATLGIPPAILNKFVSYIGIGFCKAIRSFTRNGNRHDVISHKKLFTDKANLIIGALLKGNVVYSMDNR